MHHDSNIISLASHLSGSGVRGMPLELSTIISIESRLVFASEEQLC
jgi:hypothetical protein